MSKQQNFHGLRRLAAKAGIKIGATDAPAIDPVDVDPEDEDPEDPEADPVVDPADPADPADPVVPANPEDPADPEAEPDPKVVDANTASPGYQAGYAAANGRFAAVLASPAARANLEMATDLLADSSNMSVEAIVSMCERHGGKPEASTKSAAQQLLDRTPKPNLGTDPGSKAPAADAKASRQSAAARVNARTAAGGKPTRRAGMNSGMGVPKKKKEG